MNNTPSERQSLLLLENYVQQKSKQFTLNDAAAVTGVPVLETKFALKELMNKYDCRLKVTENGDLIYDFGRNLHRRTEKSWGELFSEWASWLWQGFSILYKFLISIVLVVYFVVFVLIIIGLVLAALGSKSDKAEDAASGLFGAIFRVFLSIFEWNTIMGYTQRRYDNYGYDYDHYEERPSAIQRAVRGSNAHSYSAKDKGFVASIYDFVFGPPRVEQNPLANKQEVATFLRQNKGLINVPELQALAGWKREEAENFMTECLAHFDGEAMISPNASFYGDFSEFIRSKNRTGEAPIVYYWDEYEAPHELTGNTGWRNFWIILMNLFNLVCSLLAFGAYEAGDLGSTGLIFLGWIPLGYSLSFYAIPLFRWLFSWGKSDYYRRLNIRKRLYKAIFQSHSPRITLQTLTGIANDISKDKEEKLSEKMVQEEMQQVIFDLKGESYLDEETGRMMYDFGQLDTELDDIDQAREQKKDDNSLGNIIMEA